MRATCADCGATVRNWRGHVSGSRNVYSKDDGEFLARFEYAGACSRCGGAVVEVRAEGRPPTKG
jgi:hypothetical protein